ncbi:hypothetical protein ABZ172_04940 [Streptomyces sp. NPDC006296]|uniref:hypothetical protein n=1 Tax=Streptomyces sp. NPDC006296 TaxID=3156746 RepID=UPI0033A5F814
MTQQHVTKVAPSMRGLDHLLVGKNAAARARKWPWAWWCTCPDGHGAAKTEREARDAADAHTALRHAATTAP